ncbi:hypothetical protein MS3_00007781 [Schistosoma haematobium]|uniref:Transmembrane protein 115 n=1 Tax=Schistosoma haematobium TaxID=6185 RepID=A0A922IN63_SCHHA|nr:hypothetical protein MS3_00007781 [Schistosoma haematobium]KAH9583357.1 hypothetical protein MS3_00007781 [Schistosoma haematobium]
MMRITSLRLLHVQSLLCIFYISSFIFGLFVPLVVDLLSLPFSSIHDIYRLFTFHLVTDEICVFIFTILAIFIYAKLVFHVWSRTEILFFYWFVNTSAGILAIIPEIFFGNNIFIKRINGNSAFLSSVLVVLIQLSMDQSLVKIRGFNFKSQYGLPAVSITFLCLWTVGFIRLSSGILFCYGILCSWCYLRFLQRHPQGRRGDYRPVFAFARLFPEPIDKIVSIPSNVFYQLLLRTKFCPGLKRESEVTVEPLLTFGPHGMVSSDPERHRRIALKALNERFAKAGVSSRAQNEVIEWPSLIDPDDTQKTDNNKSDESSVIIELPTITNPSSTDTLNTLNSSNV